MTLTLLTRTLTVAVGQREGVGGVDLPGPLLLLLLLLSVLDGHLAELPSEAGGALTPVPAAALATVYTWKVTNH